MGLGRKSGLPSYPCLTAHGHVSSSVCPPTTQREETLQVPNSFYKHCLVEIIPSALSKDSFHKKLDTQIPNLPFDCWAGLLETR